MNIKTLVLLVATAVLAAVPSAQAQARFNFLETLRRVVVRAPLNTSTTVTRTTPAGPVTVTTENTFSGGSGRFDTNITLPNGNTASVSGTINVTPAPAPSSAARSRAPGARRPHSPIRRLPSPVVSRSPQASRRRPATP